MEIGGASEPDIVTLTCPDWKDHFLRFAYNLWKENVLCDTQIKCRNDDTVNAHSIVLASCSPLLKKFFMKCRPGLYTVKMDTTSAVTWGYLLEFLYTGQLQLPYNQLLTFHNMVVKLKVKQAEELTSVLLKKATEKLDGSAATTATTATAPATSTPAATAVSEVPAMSASDFVTPTRPLSSTISPLEVKKEMFEERMETESNQSTGRLLGKVSMVPALTTSSNATRVSTSTPESGIFSLAPEQEQTAQQEDAAAGDWHGQIKLHSVRSLCPQEGTTDMEAEDEHNTTTPHDTSVEDITAASSEEDQAKAPDITHDAPPNITAQNSAMDIKLGETNSASNIKPKSPEIKSSEISSTMPAGENKSTASQMKLQSPKKFTHKCTNCSRAFGTKHGLSLHRNKCDKMFGLGKFKIKLLKNGKPGKKIEKKKASKEKNNLYICTNCGRRFNSLVIYRIHMDTHNELDLRTCKLCKQVFRNSKAMYSHMRIHREPGKLPADSDSDATLTADDATSKFNDSSDVLHPDDEFIAPEGVEIESPRHLLEDADMDTEVLGDDEEEEVTVDPTNKALNVDFGAQAYDPYFFDGRDSPRVNNPSTDEKFNEAIQQSLSSPGPPYKCFLCNKLFKKHGMLETHIKVHQGISKDKCDKCGRNFAHIGALKRHRTFCSQSGSRQSSPAPRLSSSPAMPSLEQLDGGHDTSIPLASSPSARVNGSPASTEFVCRICNKVFEKSISYRLHMKQHRNSESPKKAGAEEKMSPQRKTYAGRKTSPQAKASPQRKQSPQTKMTLGRTDSHLCALCGQTFANPTALELHACNDRHEQFQCKQCQEIFQQKHLLDQHLDKAHSPPKLSPCDGDPAKSPAHQIDRNAHDIDAREKISSGTFTCTLCQVIFEKRAEFREHMLKHGQNPDFKCKCCGNRFFHSDVFQDHFKRAKTCKQDYMNRGEFPCHGSLRAFKPQTGLKTSTSTLANPNIANMNPVVVLNGNPGKFPG